MPELPEVESCKRNVLNYCYNNKIINVIINELGYGPLHDKIDDIIHETPLLIYNSLINKKIENITRKGKYLWFQMSSILPLLTTSSTNSTTNINDPKFILFHFGMTGSFVLKDKNIPLYKSFTISSNWPPKFTKLLICFENGEELAFCDPRRLGRIKVMDDVESLPPISLLAKDCYTDNITGDYLYSKFQKYNVPIKPLLLDQQKVCCGIGNWIADEVLFQSHIHPATKCNILNELDCQKIADSINNVINIACDTHADSSKFPNEWLFHSRWEKRRSSENIRTSQGYLVKYETIGGRTSAIVPELQKLYKTSRRSGGGGGNKKQNNEANDENEEEEEITEEVNDDNNNNNKKKTKKSKLKRKQSKNNITIEEDKEITRQPRKRKLV